MSYDGTMLRIGAVLSVSWQVYARNFVKLAIIAVLAALPAYVINLFSPLPPQMMFKTAQGWLVMLLGILIAAIHQAAIAYGTHEDLNQRPFGVAAAISAASGNLVALLVASLIAGLAIELGLLLLFVPGLIVACMFFVTTPACVSEQLGPIASLGRSRQLTKGYRWQILGLLLLIYGVPSVINLSISRLMLRSLINPSPFYSLAYFYSISFIIQIIVNSFVTVAVAVAYFLLRTAKEGVDISQLTTVFD